MMNESAQRALNFFGIQARSIKRPLDAKLASVYLIDDRYLLRSRRCLDNTETRFAAERELLEFVASLTVYQFPDYQPSKEGRYFFIDGRSLWTVHQLILGQSLGNWYELHVVPSRVDRQVMAVLRQLHDLTMGRFAETRISRTFFLELLQPVLTEAPLFLTDYSLQRVQSSFRRVKEFSSAYPAKQACFVHGDFHHGNILADKGKVVGFIDLDWCRVGNAFEDLGFMTMMLLRDYKTWSTEFRWQRYHDVLHAYGFNDDASILNDYIALYALFDCGVFKSATFDRAIEFYEYQRAFLETVFRTIVKSENY
jgi:aminoglycoside phosphotransferase (APT) family kinase protein